MKTDIAQVPVSLRSDAALSSWDAMIRAFLAHNTQTPVHLGAVFDAAPDFAMAHAAKGLFSLMMGRAELVPVAREALTAARTAAANTTPTEREALWITALARWLDGSLTGAVMAMEEMGMRQSVERILPAHGPDHPLRGYLLGCHAFTLEETGDYARAEATGHEGLQTARDDAWGLHAIAHVHDMRAQPDAGIALIENNTAAWDHSNNFRYHVWWHKALLHLDRGELDVALALYDSQIRADKTDDYRDISNATSLLSRLELEGVNVGPRWQELAAFSENRVEDGCLVFADLHYMLALAAVGNDTARDEMTARFARDAAKSGEMPARVKAPGQAALAGLNAFAEGQYATAFAHLARARPDMQTIGGSHAQRDVFERITIDAGLRAGQIDATEAMLQDRLALRGGHEDRFAALRFAKIEQARRIPAE